MPLSLNTSSEFSSRPSRTGPTAVDTGVRKQVSSGVLGDFHHHAFVHRDVFGNVLDQFGLPFCRPLLVAAEVQESDRRSPGLGPLNLVIPLQLVTRCPAIGRRVEVRQHGRGLASMPKTGPMFVLRHS